MTNASNYPIRYLTPHGGEADQPLHIHPAEVAVTEYPTGIIAVADPLFEEPYRIGDRSLIADPVVDDFVVAVWDYFGVHMSTRQLSRTELFETIPSLGRWNRMQHTLGAVAMTARFGGTPAQLAEMAVHDLGHRVGSHRFESLIENKMQDNDHENDLGGFLARSGFMAELRRRGLCNKQDELANGLRLQQLAHSENNPTGITNWPARTGYPETERLNYILTESAIWQTSPAEARQVLAAVQRDQASARGDQLVFGEADAAAAYAEAQLRCRTEHWVEPLTEVSEELAVALMRYVLSSGAPGMEPYDRYHPGDSLRTLEEDWQQALTALRHSDPGVQGMLTLIDSIVAWRRAIPADTHRKGYRQYGPLAPSWLTLFPSLNDRIYQPIRGVHRTGGQYVVIGMQSNKPRPVNPLVGVPGGQHTPLMELRPDLATEHAARSSWSDNPFDAVIDISHKNLRLTMAERQGIMRIVGPEVRAAWEQEVLQRPLMDELELTHRITAAGKRYRQLGAVPLAPGL